MQMTSLKRNTYISEKVKYDWNKMKPKGLNYAKIWLSKYNNLIKNTVVFHSKLKKLAKLQKYTSKYDEVEEL